MLVNLNKCCRGGFDKIETGIYGNLSGHFVGNFGLWNFENQKYEYVSYGVADNIDQVKKKFNFRAFRIKKLYAKKKKLLMEIGGLTKLAETMGKNID